MCSSSASDDYRRKFQELLRMAEELETRLPPDPLRPWKSTNNGLLECWDDDIFLNKFAPLAACHSRPDLSMGTVAAKALLNWYIGGEKLDNSTDAILTVFYCIKLSGYSNSSLFTDQLMKNGPMLQSPGTVTKVDPSSNYSSKLMSRRLSQDALLAKKLATKWYDEIWTLLDVGRIDQKQTAINLIGFLYMILMRLSVKEVNSVTSFILDKSQSTFKSQWGELSPMSASFCPPHEDMISSFKLQYTRRLPNCTKIVSAIVYSYYDGLKESNNQRVIGILRSSCLTSLERVGLGLLTWTEQAASALHISVHQLIEYNKIIPRHADTTPSLKKVLDKYASSTSAQVTWPWARMFKDEAFANLGITKNPLYAMTMMAIAHPYDKASEIWNASSLKRDIVDFDEKQAGLLAEKIKRNIQDIFKAQTTVFPAFIWCLHIVIIANSI
ncbi:hypothetical protein QAD02_023516 [Eretmocerus hayati]|uniref:Uncharacterized protein n=1 Tax=Eretmocerus hayati TaxID=131215 RepID=A0ACC2PWF5_9HYME|nr:hypothetical protein QAD02_023516 [Eretmocerus hayati]